MTPALLLFFLTYLLCGAVAQQVKPPHQKSVFVTVNTGDDLNLQCPYDSDVFKYYWFKQSLGEIPKLITVIYLGSENRGFEDEFKKNTRFKLDNEGNKNYLNISNVQLSDSATYHCGMSYSMIFEFVRSITVIVQDKQLNVKAEVRQSPHEDTEPGRSVTLNCSVHTGTCDGPHRVYWFKQSEESAAGVLYSHGGSSDQCGRNTDSQTNSCVYNLPIHNVSSQQTGTYYCAVASCGQVLFGNGTRLCVQDKPVSVHLFIGALMLTFSLLIGVTFCSCMKNSAESDAKQSASSTKAKGFPKLLQYIATEQVTGGARRQMDDTWTECIYFSVDQ